MAFRRPVSVLILTVVMTLAAYTSTKMGTISRINLPTTSGFPRNISVRSRGDSLLAGVGSSASCGLSAGVGVAVSDAGPGVAVAEDDGVDPLPSAYICVCCAWRAAARSAFAFALIILPRDFSVYALWSYTPSQSTNMSL
jgi:hypothetical protein